MQYPVNICGNLLQLRKTYFIAYFRIIFKQSTDLQYCGNAFDAVCTTITMVSTVMRGGVCSHVAPVTINLHM